MIFLYFKKFQSSAPAIQLLLGSFAELCILDDLEGRSKENRLVLGDYEGKELPEELRRYAPTKV